MHLPSLESMGFDIKADISVLLTTFLMSLLVSRFQHWVHIHGHSYLRKVALGQVKEACFSKCK